MSDVDLLDIRLLKLFDALHTEGSVTRAAQVLGLAQPTVSIGLGKLRAHFGDQLFVRGADRLLPTPLAETLVGPIRDALEALRQIAGWRSGFAPASAEHAFRIAMTDASHVTLLPDILARVRTEAPGVTLEASRIDDGLGAALQAGSIHLAGGMIPSLSTGFFTQTLFRQDWICIAGPKHPVPEGALDRAAYERHRHIGIVAGTGYQLLERAIEDLGIRRRVSLRLPGFLGLGAILAASDLIATLPRQIGTTLAAIGGLRVHECPFPIPTFEVKQHWHARYHNDPANRWLRGLCADLFMG